MRLETNNKANGKVVTAAIVLAVASLGSRLIGVLRERALTTTFGAGDVFDAFVAAFRLPDLIFNLIVVGALSAAFIPIFTEKLVKGGHKQHDEASDFASSVFNIIVVVVAVLCAIYGIFADKLVPLITPGFEGDKLRMTILLSRIMAIQPIFLSASFVISGVLNSYKKFLAYALAPIVYNVGIIIGVFYFYRFMGPAGLGWGVVLGGILHMMIQLPSAIKVKMRWRPVIHWRSSDVRKLRQMLVPRMFGLAAQQVNLFLVTVIGSSLAAGSIAVFHVATNISSLPIGLFGLAFAQAAFPTMAEQWAKGQQDQYRHTLTRVFRYISFLIIPVSLFFFLLRAQMIRVLFGDGAFSWRDTIWTFETFGLLILSLFAQSIVPLLTRAFYVQQDTRTPVIISLVSIASNIILALWLGPKMGVQGLALAFSVSTIINLVLLLGVIHCQLRGFDDEEVLTSLARIAAATVLSGIILQMTKYPVAMIVDMNRFWGVLAQLVLTFGAGIAAYLGICYLFGCSELAVLKQYLPRRFNLFKTTDTETPRFGGLPE